MTTKNPSKTTRQKRNRQKGTGSIFRRGNVWYGTIDINGKTFRVSTGEHSERSARAKWAEEILPAIRKQAGVTNSRKIVGRIPLDTMADVAIGAYRLKRIMTPEREKRYRAEMDRLIEFASGMEYADEINDQLAMQYMQSVAGIGSTTRKHKTMLDKIWQLAASSETNPWKKIEVGNGSEIQYDALTKNEIERLLDAARAYDEDRKEGWDLLILVGLTTGLRRIDCVFLDMREIDLAKGIISTYPRKTTNARINARKNKGEKVIIPICAELRQHLQTIYDDAFAASIRTETRNAENPFLLSNAEKPWYVFPKIAEMPPCEITSHLARIFDLAEISRVVYEKNGQKYKKSFHSLRVTCASRLGAAGVPIGVATKILGHSAEMFLHYFRSEENDIIAQYSRAFEV